jgi:hypothetical protein
VHLGGATQRLFGIRGKRWDERPFFQNLYNEHWTRPLASLASWEPHGERLAASGQATSFLPIVSPPRIISSYLRTMGLRPISLSVQ